MSPRFETLFVGEGTLLVRCAELLRARGDAVVGIVSTDRTIISWATERGIAHHQELEAAARALPQGVDFLVSVGNLALIAPRHLALARRLALNFHDGPLPRYAGLHATSWALLNREVRHGVTWHEMTSRPDEGRILASREFDLAEHETALTLNARCYEAGLELFNTVVAGLERGEDVGVPQDLSARTYFERRKRPDAAACLDWEMTAEELDARVRALQFGPYANPLCRPNLDLGDRVVAVGRLELTSDRSTAAPGTVVACGPDGLRIATRSVDVEISDVSRLEGEALSLDTLAASPSLRPGTRLPRLEVERAARLTDLHRRICLSESFWSARLGTLGLLDLPTGLQSPSDGGTGSIRLDLTPQTIEALGALVHDSRVFLLAGAAAYFGLLAGRDRFDVGFATPTLARNTDALHQWVAPLVPFRVSLDGEIRLRDLLAQVSTELGDVERHHTYLRDLPARVPGLASNAALSRPIHYPVRIEWVAGRDAGVGHTLPAGREGVAVRIDADGAGCELAYDRAAIDEPTMAGVGAGLARFLESAAVAPDSRLADLPLTSEAEQARLVRPATTAGATGLDTIQARFEAQVERTPDDVALVCDGLALTYSDLNRRANQVAHHLRSLGIGPESLVGVCVTRSTNMLVSLLGVLKAGGAYVPLDPSYPTARLALMLEDAAAPVIVTERRVRTTVPTTPARVVEIDGDWPVVMAQPTDNPPPLASGANLAYVIFTSGSTGRPKGVMVEHRNVLNFFDGLEGRFDTRPGTWLAVTSISFDISVQELFWPITRGFTVVLYTGSEREASTPHPTPATTAAPLDFSLFYFASDEESQGREKYKLLLDGARFADQHGFAAVWTPERHFHAFGGLYPNPSVVSAALAVITSRIQIRGGSVVLPLHTPVRVAEEWALVDNLSSGRVGIAFAAGWQSNDFVLRPESYADRKAVMLRDVEIVRRLWRGETLTLPDGSGKPVTIQTLPRPVQAELPVWLTAAGNPETFRIAGEIGAGVLTHLLGQTFDEVGQKIRLYRDAWQAAGRSGQGHVTLMLHTFVGEDTDAVREIVRQPFTAYLATALDLVRNAPAQFPTHQPPSGAQAAHLDRGMREATEEDLDALLAFAFERYFETSALLGSVDRCVEIADAVRALGADEVGCLIDYGVHPAVVLPSLRHLDTVRRRMQAAATPAPADASVAGLITRHRVSHLQCTPSMARMLLSDAESRVAVGALGTWLIGGEALPPSLADDATSVARLVLNMYGPTETTIWSTSASVRRGERVTIGTPLANQQVVVLSRHGQLLPAGIPGELCIGGAGVVRGYLHRPDLTAERFVAPRAMAPVGRLYRTGDLGRLRPDGQIEFLGRLDHQIKIRGYRVELGEIEAILADHPLVREAIVVAREDTPGHERLVGYIVPRSTPGPTASELKAHVEARLPDFMVPSAFLDLDALPLTPNGKVDRAALPPPERSRPDRHDGYVAPKSELERSIAVVLARALHVEHVGVDDNFFDLGAHSLLMVQVHSELQELLGRPLSLISLFRFPTVSALAAHLSNDDTGDAPGLTRSAERADRRRESLARRQQLRRSAGRA